MPELGFCSLCGKWAVVHGNKESGIMLCDRCCPCYNHCPPMNANHGAGKYYNFGMMENWYRDSFLSLFHFNGGQEE